MSSDTVRDIMATDVITVSPKSTVRELARVLAEHQITGVPVVDSTGRLVGVVSATDIVRLASEPVRIGAEPTWSDVLDHTDPSDVPPFFRAWDASWWDWGALDESILSTMDETPVEHIMTSVPFTVPPETTVSTLARFLSERKIHRAVVTGPQGLAGIVTTFDVLRACHEHLTEAHQA